jgi:hypothetical protein
MIRIIALKPTNNCVRCLLQYALSLLPSAECTYVFRMIFGINSDYFRNIISSSINRLVFVMKTRFFIEVELNV